MLRLDISSWWRIIIPKMQRNYDFIFKVVFVGPSGVGKTALLQRYADDVFE
jgi:GTPase SAR1 family protein